MRHCDRHHILTDAQHGFRKRRSCETHLSITLHDLVRTIDNRGQTNVLLLDFLNVFDKVTHHRLLHNIYRHGIRRNIPKLIKEFLHGREWSWMERPWPTTAPDIHKRPARVRFSLIREVVRRRLHAAQKKGCITCKCMSTVLWPEFASVVGKWLARGVSSTQVPSLPHNQQESSQSSPLWNWWAPNRRSAGSKVHGGSWSTRNLSWTTHIWQVCRKANPARASCRGTSPSAKQSHRPCITLH